MLDINGRIAITCEIVQTEEYDLAYDLWPLTTRVNIVWNMIWIEVITLGAKDDCNIPCIY